MLMLTRSDSGVWAFLRDTGISMAAGCTGFVLLLIATEAAIGADRTDLLARALIAAVALALAYGVPCAAVSSHRQTRHPCATGGTALVLGIAWWMLLAVMPAPLLTASVATVGAALLGAYVGARTRAPRLIVKISSPVDL